MAEFGEDFDLPEFRDAFASEEPDELNKVNAVERGVDRLYNYIAELYAFGLELAGDRAADDEPNAARDLRRLEELGILSKGRVRSLQRLRELRRLMVQEYTIARAEQVHEAALLLLAELPAVQAAYVAWAKAGFET